MGVPSETILANKILSEFANHLADRVCILDGGTANGDLAVQVRTPPASRLIKW